MNLADLAVNEPNEFRLHESAKDLLYIFSQAEPSICPAHLKYSDILNYYASIFNNRSIIAGTYD